MDALYGFLAIDIERVKKLVSVHLKTRFSPGDSLYMGEHYRAKRAPVGGVSVHH